MRPKALITGITGQDGSYLAEHLLRSGYEVHGVVRRVAAESTRERLGRISRIRDEITLHPATMDSYASLFSVFSRNRFQEVYHLAAQSFVSESFEDPFSTMSVNVNGTHYILESIRRTQPECKFYFAGSSEMFGDVVESPQNESTPFRPRSPYAISKVAGFHLARNYRESYGMFCCSGVLFNHESPRRGSEFVTRKISLGVAQIILGKSQVLSLGNLAAKRDWGYAKEYVVGMHQMLQQERPDDFVLATGETHSVQEFCEVAFAVVGLDYRNHVQVDHSLLRPSEVPLLVGEASRARSCLKWEAKTTFQKLVEIMVRADLDLLGKERVGSSASRTPAFRLPRATPQERFNGTEYSVLPHRGWKVEKAGTEQESKRDAGRPHDR